MPKPDFAVPVHLGLILDGNRRWAKEKGVSDNDGHKQGYETLKTIGLAALDRGVQYLTAYVFSTENWQRSQDEVGYIMRLFLWVAQHELEDLHGKGVRVRFIASREGLDKKVLAAIDKIENKTKHNTKGTLAICFNYGGQQEIADAAKSLLQANFKPEDVTVEAMQSHLYAPDIPPIDLIIRTSGEQRLSNFMLWRAAYSELIFVDKFWPDFTAEDLDECLSIYKERTRRFGT